MKNTINLRMFLYLFSLLAGSVLMPPAIAATNAAAEAPLERNKQFVAAMIAAEKADEKSYRRVDEYINYEYISSQTIQPHRAKFTDAQAKDFKANLTRLIRMVAYPRSSTFYREAEYQFEPPESNANVVEITQTTYMKSEDINLDIGYHWQAFGDKWMIIDLSFDGDSMVKDYQNQFGRIIANDGVEGLLKKVAEKLAELEKTAK